MPGSIGLLEYKLFMNLRIQIFVPKHKMVLQELTITLGPKLDTIFNLDWSNDLAFTLLVVRPQPIAQPYEPLSISRHATSLQRRLIILCGPFDSFLFVSFDQESQISYFFHYCHNLQCVVLCEIFKIAISNMV